MPATVTASTAVRPTRLTADAIATRRRAAHGHPITGFGAGDHGVDKLGMRVCASTETARMLTPDAWAKAGVPLLRDPRELIKRLHGLHRPEPGTAVVAVLDGDGRPVASASFAMYGESAPDADAHDPAGARPDENDGVLTPHPPVPLDGWECRNMILAHLRLIVPDDLRRATPTRTTILLLCRDGRRGWEPDDGRWMWGLRDACALHGLRSGAVVVLADDGWQVVADGRGGRTPVPLAPPTPPSAPAPPTPLPTSLPSSPPTGGAREARKAHAAQSPSPPADPPGAPEHPAARTGDAVAAEDVGMVAAYADYPDGLGPPVRGPVVRLVPDVANALHCSSA